MKLSEKRSRKDYNRLLIFVIACILSSICVIYVDYCNIDDDFLKVIISVYPVLFGFCITIIGISGSLDAAFTSVSWETLELYQTTFQAKIMRLALLASIYGVIILISIILLCKACTYNLIILHFLEKALVFLGVLSLFYTFFMPFWLYSLYCERYKVLILSKGAPKI